MPHPSAPLALPVRHICTIRIRSSTHQDDRESSGTPKEQSLVAKACSEALQGSNSQFKRPAMVIINLCPKQRRYL
eukprot:2855546-Amphidinium_carterae.1